MFCRFSGKILLGCVDIFHDASCVCLCVKGTRGGGSVHGVAQEEDTNPDQWDAMINSHEK